MLSALTNGADPNPQRPARRGPGGQASHPNALAAKAAEEKILGLLKAGPLKLAEIAAATQGEQSTTSERLRCLRQRGLASPGVGGAWAATA